MRAVSRQSTMRTRAASPALREVGAQGRVVDQALDGMSDGARVKGVNQQPAVATTSGSRAVAGDDGRAAAHRFERGKPEAFKERRVDEAECARVQRGQVGSGT